MNKTLVLYFSKYGTTKKYSEWIAEDLNGNIFDIKYKNKIRLNEYDTIVLGSGLYAGSIKGINLLVKNFEKIKGKKLIIFTCGLADCSKTENIDNINRRLFKVIPEKVLEKVKIFYLQGGIDYKKLSLKHKIMMAMLKYMVLKKGKDEMDDEDREFLHTYGQAVDFTERKNIDGIINYCRSN